LSASATARKLGPGEEDFAWRVSDLPRRTERNDVTQKPRILYCHCAHAAVLPETTRQSVLEGLTRSGASVRFVADLCELAARRDPSLADFAADGATIIACHARAVRWLMAYAGAPLGPGVTVLSMRTQAADDILSHLAAGGERVALAACPPVGSPESSGGQAAGGTPGSATPTFAPKAPGDWIPWFPVIDMDRCKHCGQCRQFCLFGVYTADAAGRVSVAKPEKCKTNCPACARICPQAAIIFPKFSDGPINGDETPPPARPEAPIDFSSLAGLDFHEALRRRSALLRDRQSGGGKP
jgi:NAD-dependent dihydropyrimidine dehydrogenase PreA subunit